MVALTIGGLGVSKELALDSGSDVIDMEVIVRAAAPPPAGLRVEVQFILVSASASHVIGTVPCAVEFGPLGAPPSPGAWRALARLKWTNSLSAGRYPLRARFTSRLGSGAPVPGGDLVHPRMVVLLPSPGLPPDVPEETIARPRGSLSTLPLARSNLVRADSLGLQFSLTETGYPLAELPPGDSGLVLKRLVKQISDPVPQTGLSRDDHIFCVVYDPAAAGDDWTASDALPSDAAVRRSDGLYDQAITEGDGFDRDEQMVSTLRDAIEANPNHLRAYLEIAQILIERRFPADVPRGRRYFINLYLRLLAAVSSVAPLLDHGDPERQTALRIWDRVGVYIIRHMKTVTRIRLAYQAFPAIGRIQQLRELGLKLGLADVLKPEHLSMERLAAFRIPPTEKFSEAELAVLIPHVHAIPLNEYVRRRWPTLDAITYKWVYEVAWKQFAPLQYASTQESAGLKGWIDFLRSVAPPG